MIRPLRDEDVPPAARIWRELRPDAVHSERGFRHLLESVPPRAGGRAWVAEEGGVVAWAWTHRRWWRATNSAFVWIGVMPQARGAGVGGRLYELAAEHVASLGVERLHSEAVGDEAGEGFLLRRGFVQTRTVVISAVDPRRIDTSERLVPSGYRLVPYADADPERLYELELEASNDEPGDSEPHSFSFDEWRREIFEQPDLSHEGSFAVFSCDEAVSYSALSVDAASRRGRNEGTGTARAHRGRGLASLAKVAQLRWAAEHGVERVITDNDEENAPMLEINRRLGYVPFVERRVFVKQL